MDKTCQCCKYVGPKSDFTKWIVHSICNKCYHQKNQDPFCSVCHEYCCKTDIHKKHFICAKCWNTYKTVKYIIKNKNKN